MSVQPPEVVLVLRRSRTPHTTPAATALLPATLAEPVDSGIAVLREQAETLPGLLQTAGTQAREQLGPRLESALETALEVAEDRLTDAATRSRPARREARRRAEAAVLALKGDLPAKRRRWPKAIVLLGAGVAVGAVAGLVMQRRQPEYGTAETYPPVGTVPPPGPVPPESVTLPTEPAQTRDN